MNKSKKSVVGLMFLITALLVGLLATNMTLAEEKKDEIPSWVKKITFKGDLRLRFQHDDQEGSAMNNEDTRDRLRYRYRIGVFANVTDTTTVGFGIASGGDDPRSTNETWDDTFETKNANIDYAFVEWEAQDWLMVKGGKIKGMPFFKVADLLWDSDINPEGIHFGFEGGNDVKGFFNAGYYVLDEWKTSLTDNPNMMVIQPGIKWKFGDGHLKVGVAYYMFDNLQGYPYLEHTAETNTIGDIDKNLDGTIDEDEEDLLLYEYDSYAVDLDFGYKFDGAVPYFGIFANYVSNDDPSSENTGNLYGIHFGHKKVKERGHWLVKALFRSLERDAFLDTFPDSNAFDGRTGVEGPELIVEFGLAKNVIFGIDYYDMEDIREVPVGETPVDYLEKDKSVLQLDLIWKF